MCEVKSDRVLIRNRLIFGSDTSLDVQQDAHQSWLVRVGSH